MELDLSRLMGTDGSEPADEDAATEVLAKFATDNGIDLSELSEEEQAALWSALEEQVDETDDGDKTAAAENSPEDDELAQLAVAEWSEKRAEAEALTDKLAEADTAGRVMAHAWVDEIGTLCGLDKEAGSEGKAMQLAGNAAKALKNKKLLLGLGAGVGAGALGFGAGKALEARKKEAMPNIGAAFKSLRGRAKNLGAKGKDLAVRASGKSDLGHALQQHRKAKALKGMGAAAGVARDAALKARNRSALRGGLKAVGTAGAIGGAGAGVGMLASGGKKKEASALDELAEREAVKIAAASEYDADEAIERILAISTLGLPQSEKVAAAQTPEEALEVRAFEYLEAAGYPVE